MELIVCRYAIRGFLEPLKCFLGVPLQEKRRKPLRYREANKIYLAFHTQIYRVLYTFNRSDGPVQNSGTPGTTSFERENFAPAPPLVEGRERPPVPP